MYKANSRLATERDDDERLPVHWAVSYNHLPIVELLVSRKDFDPDVQVSIRIPVKVLQYLCLHHCAGCFGLDASDDCCEFERRG